MLVSRVFNECCDQVTSGAFLLGALSVLVGMGIAWIALRTTRWSEGTQEFWFLILAFAISIPVDKLFHLILNKLIGKPEV